MARTVPRIPCKVWKVLMLLALSRLRSPTFSFFSVQSIARRSGHAVDVGHCIFSKLREWESMACVNMQLLLKMFKTTASCFRSMFRRTFELALLLTPVAVLRLRLQS